MEKTFTPAEVAERLVISASTLRKYSLLLESEGIKYKRNAQNSRQYNATDVMTIKRMINLVRTDGVTLENAAYAVTKGNRGVNARTGESGVIHDGDERQDGDVTALLIGEIRELKKEIQQQNETIDGFRIAQEERDTYFIKILENLQGEINQLNEQAQLPEPEEEAEQSVQKDERGFWARVFNK